MDDKFSISIAKNLVSHSRSKHININYHFIQEQVKDKIMELVQCRIEKNLEDIFTKLLKAEDISQNGKEARNAKLGLRGSVRISNPSRNIATLSKVRNCN